LAGDGDRHGHHDAACAHDHIVGADDDAVGVLCDAAGRLRQMDRVAELGGDGVVDGTKAANGPGVQAQCRSVC